MASRERRRAERSKRKARSADRRAQISARYEARNRAAREVLEPLSEDERPAVVTAGAVISGLIGASIVIAYLTGATVNGERPPILQVIPAGLADGRDGVGHVAGPLLGGARLPGGPRPAHSSAALGLAAAGSAPQLGGNLALIAIAGTLFYLHGQGAGPDPDARARPARVGARQSLLPVLRAG